MFAVFTKHRHCKPVLSPYGSDLHLLTLINPLKPQIVYVMFKNSVRAAKKTPHLTVTKINWLTLFKEIIAVYSENRTRPINTNEMLLVSEAGATCG
jgi:hypothetical protein